MSISKTSDASCHSTWESCIKPQEVAAPQDFFDLAKVGVGFKPAPTHSSDAYSLVPQGGFVSLINGSYSKIS